jgi:hypothetical protein
MNLREAVDKYLEIAGDFGRAVPLSSFGLSREETEKVFAPFDEDYHISRYIHLSEQKSTAPAKADEAYQINGFKHTHVSIDAEIAEVL